MIFSLTNFFVTVIATTTPILLVGDRRTGRRARRPQPRRRRHDAGGRVTGFAVTFEFGPDLGDLAPWVGVLAAAAASALSATLFGALVLTLGSNQVATGLALAIFGIGLSSLIGAGYVGMTIPAFDTLFPDTLASDPVGRVLFGYSPLVYFALVMVFAVGWFLNRTRAGLVLRAVGENDNSAHLIGYPVLAIRYAAIALAARWQGSPAPLFDGHHADVGRTDDGGPRLDKTTAAGLALPALGGRAFAAEPLKVGFVYLGAIGDYGWTWSHDQGRKQLQNTLKGQVITNYVENSRKTPAPSRS